MLKTPEDAAGGGSFVEHDLTQAGQLGFQFAPKPRAHVFDSGVFQAGDFIEVGVIQLIDQGLHGTADLGVIVNPADCRIHFAGDRYFDLEAVPVHQSAFVTLRGGGQGLGCFEGILFDEGGSHLTSGGPVRGGWSG